MVSADDVGTIFKKRHIWLVKWYGLKSIKICSLLSVNKNLHEIALCFQLFLNIYIYMIKRKWFEIFLY